LLRQTLEIIFRNALKIDLIKSKNNKIVKIQLKDYIEIFKKNKDYIKMNCNIDYIEKIYEWSNYYIHTGYNTYLWEIEWAEYIIEKYLINDKIEINNELFISLEEKIGELLNREIIIQKNI
jgi:hypothetical protein